jgi:hypothetical protein
MLLLLFTVVSLRHIVQGQPHLSYLCLGGLCLTDSAAFALAGITRLRDLELHNSPLLTPEGVAQLVKLRQLSRLKVDGIGACRSSICCLTSDSQVSFAALTVGWGLMTTHTNLADVGQGCKVPRKVLDGGPSAASMCLGPFSGSRMPHVVFWAGSC